MITAHSGEVALCKFCMKKNAKGCSKVLLQWRGKEVFLGKWLLYAGLSMNKVCNTLYSRKVGGKYMYS
jgi:hypothetical protein